MLMEQADPAMESLIKEIGEMAAASTFDVSLSPATKAVVDPDDCLISLVKEDTRAVDPGEYSPDKVHIGPYYYGCRSRDPYLSMEKEKKEELLHGFLPRDERERQAKLRSYLMAMAAEGVEGRARQYYNHTFSNMSKDEFACMLLLDGCYLLSRFVPVMERRVPTEDIAVVRDVVFLLQNQIPFFVLEEIHRLITGGAEDDESFVLRAVTGHVEKLVRRHGYSVATLKWDPAARRRPCHLLHLLHMYFRPAALDLAGGHRTCSPVSGEKAWEVQVTVDDPVAIKGEDRKATSPVPPVRFRGAAYYHVGGVRLVKRKLDGVRARSILDVELAGGTLHMPCLTVDNNTLRILRNMVALEQNSPQLGSHATAYSLFMSQMASTEKDVALLVAEGIVVHFLGSDGDVAAEFSGLCKGLQINVNNPEFSYLRREQEALEELCRDGWRRSMAWLRHAKCNNPLMFLALVAAVVTFLSTVLQALFAVLAYVKGKNS